MDHIKVLGTLKDDVLVSINGQYKSVRYKPKVTRTRKSKSNKDLHDSDPTDFPLTPYVPEPTLLTYTQTLPLNLRDNFNNFPSSWPYVISFNGITCVNNAQALIQISLVFSASAMYDPNTLTIVTYATQPLANIPYDAPTEGFSGTLAGSNWHLVS